VKPTFLCKEEEEEEEEEEKDIRDSKFIKKIHDFIQVQSLDAE